MLSIPAIVVLLCLWAAIVLFTSKKGKNGLQIPPGPRGLPILGNLHMLGSLPHLSLQKLAQKYGPIMSIRLGHVPAIVVSSPEYAELILRTHDSVFAGRPSIEASKYLNYGRKGIVFAQYGPYWSKIRKFCTRELLSNTKVESFEPVRRQEVVGFVDSVRIAAESKSVIDVTAKVRSLIEAMTYRMIFGFKDEKSSFKQVAALSGMLNLADYVPFLGALDLQGLRRKMKIANKDMDEFLEKAISLQGQHGDFMEALLSLIGSNDGQEGRIDRDNIKAIITDLVAAGSDTTITVIDWTMAELLRHPRVLKLVREEVQNVVGLDRMVEEADLVKLEYLQMVIKESMRLHPLGAITIHEAMEDVTINGYFIAKKTRVILNNWAIGRDANAWSNNAHEFYPERFVGTNIGVQGHHFQFLPFSSGRRMCPGVRLGSTMVELVLAQLLHCFDWELPHGELPKDIDMSEELGITLPRASHLLAIPTSRLSLH